MKLGFAGLVRMAANCVRAGHQVTVWNRSPDPVGVFLKTYAAKAAKDPGQLASGCETVITMLANDEAACAVYLGPGGLIQSPGARLLVEMGTISPGTVERCDGRG